MCTPPADYKRQTLVQDMHLADKSLCSKHLQPIPSTAVKARGLATGAKRGTPLPCSLPSRFWPRAHAPRALRTQHSNSSSLRSIALHRALLTANVSTEFFPLSPPPLRAPSAAAGAAGAGPRPREQCGLQSGTHRRHTPCTASEGIPRTDAAKLLPEAGAEPPLPPAPLRRPGTRGPAAPSSFSRQPRLASRAPQSQVGIAPSKTAGSPKAWTWCKPEEGLRQGGTHPYEPTPRSLRPPPAALRGRGGRDAPPGDAAAAAPFWLANLKRLLMNMHSLPREPAAESHPPRGLPAEPPCLPHPAPPRRGTRLLSEVGGSFLSLPFGSSISAGARSLLPLSPPLPLSASAGSELP